MTPIATELIRVAYEDSHLRVECNRVRNAITAEESIALRIAPSDNTRHVVVVIPFLDDGRLVLLGRYRYAVGRWSIELPRFWGQTSDAGWREAVEEHLLKETGLKAEGMRLLGAIEVDPAIVSVSTIVILAEGCTGPLAKPADAAESIAGCIALSPGAVDDLIRRGEIACGTTLAALCLYRAQSLGCLDQLRLY